MTFRTRCPAPDRLSSACKRGTKAVSFLVALLLSILVNVDAIRVVHVPWSHPQLADDLKAPAAVAKGLAERSAQADPAKRSPAGSSAPIPQDPASSGVDRGGTDVSPDAPAASAPLTALDHHLPMGRLGQESRIASSLDVRSRLLGWLITAVAALFGAPFRFDTLQAVTHLKGTGASPNDDVRGRAAAN